ncbi:MAG: tRNA threonylcarbamoyladenosine biosynthesis protein TsaB [Thermoleophilaceae bacterium]|nr:tRNA threonylcarbamoyladenosine biosynthesis protein TsaB [Thermoleophilaceae bacterium]
MNILGFDTATAATTVCVLRDGEPFEHEPPIERLFEPPGHARELMPAIDELMRAAGLEFGDLDALAVGIGPGGFTGLRIGIATAHGIAQAASIPLHPVLSLDALAAGIESEAPLPLIDARRKEVYGPGPFVGSIDEAIALAPEGALAAGDGSIRFREALESAGIRVAPGDSRMHVVRSLYICRLAEAVQPAPPESVVPCYLRAPDAKPPSRSAG